LQQINMTTMLYVISCCKLVFVFAALLSFPSAHSSVI
jgi:hypothetical protein